MKREYCKWVMGMECPQCGYLTLFWKRLFEDRGVCPECGQYPAAWSYVVMRWVIEKTGFWFWQWRGYWQKKDGQDAPPSKRGGYRDDD